MKINMIANTSKKLKCMITWNQIIRNNTSTKYLFMRKSSYTSFYANYISSYYTLQREVCDWVGATSIIETSLWISREVLGLETAVAELA